MPLDLQREADFWRNELTENILPWWLRHAIDVDHGGICSCIADDGAIQSHEKYVWSQVRAVWTFAAAYNRIEQNAAWLDAAKNIYDFVVAHGINDDGDFNFRLSREGDLLEGPQSIQTDAFAICALVEYAKASNDDAALDLAMNSFRRTSSLIANPGSYKTAPYPIPEGAKAQRVSMQFSLAYWELAKATGDADVQAEAQRLTDDVLDNFRRPDLRASVEYLGLDNNLLQGPIGSYVSAGHAIETAWFQIENIRHRDDHEAMAKACQVMQWAFDYGWDDEFGGLYLGGDIKGGEPYLPNWDTKIWWPHCEAICGLLMAYEVCGQSWCLDWYEKVRDWSLDHFPVKDHGEWTQRLDRQGRKLDRIVALPVKDPFHLPRALVYAVESCQRMNGVPTP